MIEHFLKHGDQIINATNASEYSVEQYLDDANWIINNGQYIPEKNAFISFMKNVYYGFVGMDQSMENITTFHIKSIYEIIKATGNSCFEK